jgi:hypothetical protein
MFEIEMSLKKVLVSQMQDGAIPHTTLDMLQQAFPGHLTYRGTEFHYPLHSPHPSLPNAYSWGLLNKSTLCFPVQTGPVGKYHACTKDNKISLSETHSQLNVVGRVVGMPALHFGGSRFKSQPKDWIVTAVLHGFSVSSGSPSKLGLNSFLVLPYQSIIHYHYTILHYII